MAKNKEQKEEQDVSFKNWDKLHVDVKLPKSEKKRQYEVVKQVRELFQQSKNGRINSCFWNQYNSDDTGSGSGGGDWSERWDKQEKAYTMWYQEPSLEDFQSNIKSPMTTGRVNAFVNQFRKINIGWDARPNNPSDKNAAKVAAKALDYWYNKNNVKGELVKVAWEAAVHGSGLFKVGYKKEIKRIRPTITDPKEMTDDQKELIKTGYRNAIFGNPIDRVVDEDIKLEHVPIRELYIDPYATTLHGEGYKARYVIRRRQMDIEEFRQTYAAHPSAQNVEEVKPMGKYEDADHNFFKKPDDLINDDSVELLEFEGQLGELHDCHIVIANDLLILDSVLPMHKEITYHKVDFITFPNQFYGIGIADLAMNIQGSQEILMNMASDYIFRSYNLRYFIDSEIYGQLEDSLIRPDNELVPMDLSDGRSINQKIQQQVNSPIGFDLFRLGDIFEQNVTMATQIDPQQLSLMSKGKTATESVMNKEQLESMISGVIDNFANQGMFYAGRQIWKLMQQFYTVPMVKSITGKDEESENKVKYRTIRIEGFEIDLNEDTGDLEFNKSEGYNYFELKEEFLKTADELDIIIRPDTLEVESKALRMQRIQEAFAQLIQFAANPARADQMAQNPVAMVNIVKLFEEYFNAVKLPKDLLITTEENEKFAIQQAEEHVMKILQGEIIVPEPGKSPSHIKYQSKVILAIDAQISDLENQIDESLKQQETDLQKQIENGQIIDMATINPELAGRFMDPASGQEIEIAEPQPPEELQIKIENLLEVNERLKAHNAIEAMPADVLPQLVNDPNRPGAPESGVPGPEPMPEEQLPVDPSQGGMPQVPMPEEPGMQDVMPGFGGQPV